MLRYAPRAVPLMYTNASATMYRFVNGNYERTTFDKVCWDESASASAAKNGMTSQYNVRVFIPYSGAALKVTPGKDLMVEGTVDFTFDNSSEQSQAESLKRLREKCGKVYSVMSCDNKTLGYRPLWHYDILLK